MTFTLDLDSAVRVARTMMDEVHCDAPTALAQLPVSGDVRTAAILKLEEERALVMTDPAMIVNRDRKHVIWLPGVDVRSLKHWLRFRQYLIDRRQLPEVVVNESIDPATHRILGEMEDPAITPSFRVLGLVVGHVQSGKTTNYSGLIAKGVDTGFRLFIVLSGIHDGLRLQTQRRLNAELVTPLGVGAIASDREIRTYTGATLKGDFDPGSIPAAALTGSNPVLLVVKKNKSVLSRLINWLDQLPEGIRHQIPVMVIDDEADQASVNTKGNRTPAEELEDQEDDLAEEVAPSAINERIRSLLLRFSKVSYVAYTATPFANVLIDHEAHDRDAGGDLYPRDYILSLEPPPGYHGAEAIFGQADDPDGGDLDIIRTVPDDDVQGLIPETRDEVADFQPHVPQSLKNAIDDFLLAGAARALRGQGGAPASMLIHTSLLTRVQRRLSELVREHVEAMQLEWKYRGRDDILVHLSARWEDFRRVTRALHADREQDFDEIIPHLNRFLNQLVVRELNSSTEGTEELDYDRDPELKVIVIGGNRLSRGLTLEGLLVSYYLRPAKQYDTLLQMGRWFGYRAGYEDLTRIYTTSQLEQWFRDLATREAELRQEISRYDREKRTPLDFGVRIRTHPALMVTSKAKMRDATVSRVSFKNDFPQTINFQFADVEWLRHNVSATKGFLSSLGAPTENAGTSRPLWRNVPYATVLELLDAYRMDGSARKCRQPALSNYIKAQVGHGELTEWTVAVAGRDTRDAKLGTIDLGVAGGRINLIERTRIVGQDTLQAIASKDDESVGLSAESVRAAKEAGGRLGDTLRALRRKRSSGREGLLLIYPISKASGHRGNALKPRRVPIFEEPSRGAEVIGLALSLPDSDTGATAEYIVGTVGEGVR